MTDGIEDPYALMRALEATCSIPLTVGQVATDVGSRWAVRPRGIPDGNGFAVVLSTSLHSAHATLLMDRYSGPLLRRVGDGVVSIPEEWWSIFQDAEDGSDQVWLEINGERVASASAIPLTHWSSLSIEFSRRLQRGSGSPQAPLISLGGRCLTSIAAALQSADDEDDVDVGELEGASRRAAETRYERSPVNRLACIEYFGATCWACDFNFADMYGELGSGFIVVHHVNPVSQLGGSRRLDPRAELVPLCANCHYMVHRENPPLAPERLRELLELPPREARPAARW